MFRKTVRFAEILAVFADYERSDFKYLKQVRELYNSTYLQPISVIFEIIEKNQNFSVLKGSHFV